MARSCGCRPCATRRQRRCLPRLRSRPASSRQLHRVGEAHLCLGDSRHATAEGRRRPLALAGLGAGGAATGRRRAGEALRGAGRLRGGAHTQATAQEAQHRGKHGAIAGTWSIAIAQELCAHDDGSPFCGSDDRGNSNRSDSDEVRCVVVDGWRNGRSTDSLLSPGSETEGQRPQGPQEQEETPQSQPQPLNESAWNANADRRVTSAKCPFARRRQADVIRGRRAPAGPCRAAGAAAAEVPCEGTLLADC